MTRRSGFTLLELLVALAILGILTLMLAGSTQYGIAAWHRTDAHAATAGEWLLSRSVLSRALERAYPACSLDGAGHPRVAFEGDAAQVSFLAPAPGALGAAGLARFRLGINGPTGDRRLELAGTRELELGPLPPASTLVDHAAEIDLAYYGTPGDGQPPVWQPTWLDRADLPLLVRVRVTLPPEDQRHWPDLVVEPRIAVDVSCIYDPLSYRCRGR